jgi:hypothetical protein
MQAERNQTGHDMNGMSTGKSLMSTAASDRIVRHEELIERFIDAIEQFRREALSSRDLAQFAETLTTTEEVAALDDELLSHTFWALRHLVHQPACWAAKPEELYYLARCLQGEEDFDQTVADSFREA